MTSTLNQLSNQFGVLPVASALGFVGGQGIAILAQRDSLSNFTIGITGGLTFIMYGFLSSDSLKFVTDDFTYIENEIFSIPDRIKQWYVTMFPPVQRTFFGIPI